VGVHHRRGVYGISEPDGAIWDRKVRRTSTIKLASLIEGGVTAFDDTYEMADNWEHRIVIERVGSAEPDTLYPDLRGGERRCPPKDCGGFPAINAGREKGRKCTD
jgi:hypothetical protein